MGEGTARMHLWRWATAVVALALTVPGAATVAAAEPGVPARAGASVTAPAPAPTTILVQYRPGTSALDRAQSRASAAVTRERGHAGTRMEVVRPAHGQSIRDAVSDLNADPRVTLAEPNWHLQLALDPAQEPYRAPFQWGLENSGGDCAGPNTAKLGLTCVTDVDIDAIRGWGAATGSGITIAVLDDGLDFSQTELAAQAWSNPGETGTDGGAGDKSTNNIDDDGNGFVDDVKGVNLCTADASTKTLHRNGVDWHGTAVASIAAAAVNNDKIAGVAPDAKLMAVRWLIGGKCDTMDYAIAAIDYAVENGADVINASWGGPENSLLLEEAIGRANAAGVLVVAAAGNGGSTSRFYPAASSAANVISVGAHGPNGALAGFSNRGSWVDLAAPGDAIAALCLSPSTAICPRVWSLISGTSFAAPHATGVAALVLQLRPALLEDAPALRTKLLNSGVKSAKLDDGLTYSGRRLNAGYAVDIAPPSAPKVEIRARASSTIGAASASMTIAWPASTDASGIDSYRVRYRKAGATSWTTVTAGTTARQVAATLGYDQAYEVQVIARDRGGNSASTVVTTTPRLYSEASTRATYSGTWSLATSTLYSGGDARTTGTAGRSVTYAITGRSAAWVAAKGPTRGSAKVYLDGTYVTTVSLYATTAAYRRVVWTRSWAEPGDHTVRIVVNGTSGHPRIDVDAVVVAR